MEKLARGCPAPHHHIHRSHEPSISENYKMAQFSPKQICLIVHIISIHHFIPTRLQEQQNRCSFTHATRTKPGTHFPRIMIHRCTKLASGSWNKPWQPPSCSEHIASRKDFYNSSFMAQTHAHTSLSTGNIGIHKTHDLLRSKCWQT